MHYLCNLQIAKPAMNKTIPQRLQALRELMKTEGLSAFIFPSTDPHHGEYIPSHWKAREYLSGFNGSAGTLVVTTSEAALWTDSRYFLAAAQQLKGSTIQLMKIKVEGTPSIPQWLGQKLAHINGPQVAIDGMIASINEVEALIHDLRQQGGITLRTNLDPLGRIWPDRPAIPCAQALCHPLEFCGETAPSKLARLRQALREMHAEGILVSALDDIAWLLNIRGADVHCNPVAVAYLLVSPSSATLFIEKEKADGIGDYLKGIGVETDSYANIARGLRAYRGYNILMDPDETSYALFKACEGRRILRAQSPVPPMKAIKNQTEIQGFRRAMERDGVALVRFLKWLEESIGKTRLTEIGIDERLTALRAEQPLFRGLSFDTIAAYGPHGAIVHYEATPETDAQLEPRGFILIDSGAQYLDGTTDVTRTIALGPLSEEEKRVYTLVLKGHIALSMCIFPAGACGTQLDILARRDMWRHGYNYLHGTGHGVGSYLNVHEGPHQIRMEYKPAPLRAGMTVTDEPGIYLEGHFGVRTENTLLIIPANEKLPNSGFLTFEPLTLCPIDKKPIIPEMLSPEETAWLNSYHQMVFCRLSPLLPPEEAAWLREACKPLGD